MAADEGASPAITLSGVTFSIEDKTIIRGIDLEVPAGAYFGIVGPNGSGKTTLAYLISGILSPEGGSVDTHGLRIGLVLSNPANQIVSLVVEEDIAFGPENMELSSADINARIDSSLAAIHGEYLRQELTSALSGGELAKVAFAGQLALDADVFVLDEGTVMLDPISRATLLSTVKELHRKYKKTIVHISHRLDDLECADTVVGIVGGRITVRAHGVLGLVKEDSRIDIPGIEPGERLLYRSLLNDLGIDEPDLEKATRKLAQQLLLNKKDLTDQ
ncbi:MAG: ATP-binding cassette domain-containing protein [Deltaproteobacteria bacterium]|nr:ATP-binding cassette domain-containing protein [Deltaproteobacteria bacterium]